MNRRVIPANILFEKGDDGDMVIIEYYPHPKESKKISLTREEWKELENKKGRH